MKTVEEIRRYRRRLAKVNKELEREGFDDPRLKAAMAALDWVLMPSDKK